MHASQTIDLILPSHSLAMS